MNATANRYLLDTNILTDLIKNPGGRVTNNETEFVYVAGLVIENWLGS